MEGKKLNKDAHPEVIRNKRQPCIIFDSNNEIKEVYISQSLIHRLLHKGDERSDICPHSLYMTDITRQLNFPETEPMLFGKYFESKCLGSGADDIVLDLPRDKRTGKRRIDHDRIDDAIFRFEMVRDTTGLIIQKNNVQVDQKKVWIDPREDSRVDFPVYLTAKSDLISPFSSELHSVEYEMTVIDLKLTGDREACFSNPLKPWQSFTWGCIEKLDLTQAVMYSWLFELPFMYLVFDYKPASKVAGWKPIPIKTVLSHPTDNEAKLRQEELYQAIRWTIGKLCMMHDEGWKKEPGEQCTKCPVTSCSLKYQVKPV